MGPRREGRKIRLARARWREMRILASIADRTCVNPSLRLTGARRLPALVRPHLRQALAIWFASRRRFSLIRGRKLASELVQLIDHACELLLTFEIPVWEHVRHLLIIVLTNTLEVPEVASAHGAMPREGIDPEALVLIPCRLLGRAD